MAAQVTDRKKSCHWFTIIALMMVNICQADSFTIGVVPQFDARTTQQIWRPILKELQQRTGHSFVLRGSQTIPVFEQQLLAGEFDFAYVNPYQLLKTTAANEYIPLVRDVATDLRGILVVRKDSPYMTPEELRDQSIAFPSPNALGASLMIRSVLTHEVKIPFKPRYVNSHDSVYLNVVLGNTAAGGGVVSTLAHQSATVRDQLRVLHTTEAVTPHPLTAHPRVPQSIRDAIQQTMLSLGKTKSGQKMLSQIPIKSITIAQLNDYEPMKKMRLDEFYED